MTAKTKRTYQVYLTLSILLALALAAVRSFALLSYYDPAIGYFEAGVALPELASLLTLLALPLALSVPFVLGGGKLASEARRFHLPTAFASALLAFLLLAFAALHVSELLGELSLGHEADARATVTLLLAAGLAVLGSVSFILSASMGAEISARRALSSSAFVLFAVTYALFLYFDTTLPINAPEKLLSQLALLSVAIFFLYEARIAIARPMPGMRAAFGFLALILSAASSIPSILYYLTYGKTVLESPVHDFLLLASFLYIMARLTSLVPRSGKEAVPFFEGALSDADDEESVASVGQISFFTDEAAPPSAPGEASALLSAELSEESFDPESDEARDLFGAPDENPHAASDESISLQLTDDLLGSPSEGDRR